MRKSVGDLCQGPLGNWLIEDLGEVKPVLLQQQDHSHLAYAPADALCLFFVGIKVMPEMLCKLLCSSLLFSYLVNSKALLLFYFLFNSFFQSDTNSHLINLCPVQQASLKPDFFQFFQLHFTLISKENPNNFGLGFLRQVALLNADNLTVQ